VADFNAPFAHLPPGFSVRPIRLDDAHAIVEMLNCDAQLFTGETLFSVSEYKVDLQNPLLDLEQQTRIILNAEGSVAAIAEVHRRSPWVRPYLWVRTAPDQRGCGLGSWLIEWGIEVARATAQSAPPGARVTLGASAIEGNLEAARLLRACGFRHVRNFLQMRIEMHAPPPRPHWPGGVSIRTFRPHEDDVALFNAIEEAFSDHWGHVKRTFDEDFPLWQQRLYSDPLFDPTIYFLAMDGDEIAGFSLCLAPVPGELQAAWINLLGVRRPWRKQGLGQALLLHSFGEFHRRAVDTIGLGVDAESITGATRLYEKVGMWVQHTTVAYELELRPGAFLAEH
jgi:mycothiol synthase